MSQLRELFTSSPVLFGGQIALIVMVVVFLILAAIFIVITLTGAFFKKKPAPAPQKTEQTDTAKQLSVQNTGTDEELIAVLTAAVAASRMEKGKAGAFRVVSFTRR